MSLFSKIRGAKKAADDHRRSVHERQSHEVEAEKKPYRHVPTHAGQDAMTLGGGTGREDLRIRIREQNRRRSEASPLRSGSESLALPRVNNLPRNYSDRSINYASGTSTPVPMARQAYRQSAYPGGRRTRSAVGSRPSSAAKGRSPLGFAVSIHESPDEDELDDYPLQSSHLSTKSSSSTSSGILEMANLGNEPTRSQTQPMAKPAVSRAPIQAVRFAQSAAHNPSGRGLCVPAPVSASTSRNARPSTAPAEAPKRSVASEMDNTVSTYDWFPDFNTYSLADERGSLEESTPVLIKPGSKIASEPPKLNVSLGQIATSHDLSVTGHTSVSGRPSTSSSSGSNSSQSRKRPQASSMTKKTASYHPFPKSSKDEGTLMTQKTTPAIYVTDRSAARQPPSPSDIESDTAAGLKRYDSTAPTGLALGINGQDFSFPGAYTPPSSRPGSLNLHNDHSHSMQSANHAIRTPQVQRPVSPVSQISHRPSLSQQFSSHDRSVSPIKSDLASVPKEQHAPVTKEYRPLTAPIVADMRAESPVDNYFYPIAQQTSGQQTLRPEPAVNFSRPGNSPRGSFSSSHDLPQKSPIVGHTAVTALPSLDGRKLSKKSSLGNFRHLFGRRQGVGALAS